MYNVLSVTCTQLKAQVAQLRTDNAKLAGSYQAILSVREQLWQENAKFRSKCMELQLDKKMRLKNWEHLLNQMKNVSQCSALLSSKLAMTEVGFCQLVVMCVFELLFRMNCVAQENCVVRRNMS